MNKDIIDIVFPSVFREYYPFLFLKTIRGLQDTQLIDIITDKIAEATYDVTQSTF